MLYLGIDDAGRGPVLGPMVLAGCILDEETEKELKKLGVKDSKQLTDKRREFLAEIIKKKAVAYHYVLVSVDEIDSCENLNKLEATKMAEVINNLNKGTEKLKVIVDCPSVSIAPWKDMLKTKINELHNLEVICEHKADVNHISVSAASVLAKSVREKEMAKLREKYSNIGSGYPSDPSTIQFLKTNYKMLQDSTGLIRKSWETWKECLRNNSQKTL